MSAVKIYGPYPHRDGYRCYIKAPTGARAWCETRATAQAATQAAERQLENFRASVELSVGELADRYLEYLRAQDREPGTIDAVRTKLVMIIGGIWDQAVLSVTERQAKDLYAKVVGMTISRKKVDLAEAMRRAGRYLITLERRHLDTIEGRLHKKTSDEELSARWGDLDLFETRVLSGDYASRRGDSRYLVRLYRRLDTLSEKLLIKLKERSQKKVAAATHHVALWKARELWRWAIIEGAAKTNPWLAVRLVGKANAGKPQLTLNETIKLIDLCVQHVLVDDGALAVAVALFCGLRSSEVCTRVVRDIDGDAEYLNVVDAKNKRKTRKPEIPDCIKPAIRVRLRDRQPTDLLLPELERRPASSRQWLAEELRRLCHEAGVPEICPHALRGGATSLAYEAGALPHVIAAMVGHASSKTTEAHYATSESVQGAAQRARLRHLKVISDGK